MLAGGEFLYSFWNVLKAARFRLESSCGVKFHFLEFGNDVNHRTPMLAASSLYMWITGCGPAPATTVPYIFVPFTTLPVIVWMSCRYFFHVQFGAWTAAPEFRGLEHVRPVEHTMPYAATGNV